MWTWEIDWGDHHVPEVAGERVIDCEAGDHSAVIPCHFSVFLGVTLKKKLLQLIIIDKPESEVLSPKLEVLCPKCESKI